MGSLRSFSHQVMDLAAVMAHCCISPYRYGSLLASGVFLKSSHGCVVRGKFVFLMSRLDWQKVRKCSSVSSWFCAVEAQCVFYWERVFTESVPDEGFIVLGRPQWSGILQLCILCVGMSLPIYYIFGWIFFFFLCQIVLFLFSCI